MSARRHLLRCVLLSLAAAATAFAGDEASEPDAALRGLDPVELCGGRDVEGDAKLTETRGRYVYRFATDENRSRFRDGGERYAIQFGGACMRMGPLAGAGSPDRFVVHDERIYVFASDACRKTFLKEPARFIDRGDAAPEATDEQRRRGAELLRLAVKGMGGDEALAKCRNVRFRLRTKPKAGGADIVTERLYAFPGSYRVDTDWGGGLKYAWMLTEGGGFLPATEAPAVEASVREVMDREMHRAPVAIVQAWRRGEAHVASVGAGKCGDVAVERVAAAIRGATTTLAIDVASGRIVETSFRGRGGAGFGDFVRRFSDFRETGGLVMPFAVAVSVDGTDAPDANTIEAVDVNVELDPKTFAKPQ